MYLNKMLEILATSKEPKKIINNLLIWLGAEAKATRSFVVEIDDALLMSITYEWHSKETRSKKNDFKNISIQHIDLDFWIKLLIDKQYVTISDFEKLKIARPELYKILEPLHFKSLIAVPILKQRELVGFIGVDTLNFDCIDTVLPLLYVSSDMLYHLLYFINNNEIKNPRDKFSQIAQLSKSSIYSFSEYKHSYIETLFSVLDIADFYPYMGDLFNDVWYISDSMKETWGFESNIISDGFLNMWKNKISNPVDLEIWENDIAKQFTIEGRVHDLIYRMLDKDDKEIWIRCYGMAKWNKEGTKPLYFCGSISTLNNELSIDPLTKFFNEKSAIKEIGLIVQAQKNSSYLCFRLNGFNYVNDLKGRT